MTTTDTPRTDAETYVWQYGRENPFVHKDFARQLERELNEAKQWLDERYKALSEADERAEKSEAEVERLKSDKAHLITQCANLLEALVPSDKSPSTEWHRKQAENNKAYLK